MKMYLSYALSVWFLLFYVILWDIKSGHSFSKSEYLQAAVVCYIPNNAQDFCMDVIEDWEYR